MQVYKEVRSGVLPDEKVIDDYSVWIASDIKEVSEESGEDENPGFSGYEYTLTQYSKDEYIQMIDAKNEELEEQITDTQIALCELYEAM